MSSLKRVLRKSRGRDSGGEPVDTLTVSPSGLLFHPQLRHDGPKSSEPSLIAKNASFNLAAALQRNTAEQEEIKQKTCSAVKK